LKSVREDERIILPMFPHHHGKPDNVEVGMFMLFAWPVLLFVWLISLFFGMVGYLFNRWWGILIFMSLLVGFIVCLMKG
jgi:uncharacterized membrane protein (DUF4010 family)